MNRFFTALISVSIALLLVSCNKEKDIPVTSVSIAQATAEMYIGESVQLTATVLPNDASDKSVIWTSSKQSVATVSSTGKVTAIDEGVSTITASAGGKSSTCLVTVSKKIIAVTSVTLNKTILELTEGDTETLVATVAPDDATDKTVTWSTSDQTVATVDNAGKITAVKEGSATITAKAGEKTATCAVTVAKKVIPVESVELNKTTLALIKGESETLVATVKPDDATYKTVTWSTSNESVVAVDQTGKVTAVAGGEADITAKAGEETATCVVTVSVPVSSVTLSKQSLTLVEGESETLVVTVNPEDATDKTVTWSSSNAQIATVDQNGKVTAVKEGTTTITVNAGDKSASCVVTVNKKVIPVESIVLNKSTLTLDKGASETLIATVKPDDATDPTVTWTSSDEKVASVDANGKVVAIGGGGAVITAKAGSQEATCTVSVTVPVEGVSLDQKSVTIEEESCVTLLAKITPDDATTQTVEWTSSNAGVATVDANGKVSGITVGTATITAQVADKQATCVVTVVKAPEFVDLGLSVKWRKYNVGASHTHDYGNYFAWGEVSQKAGYYYYWPNYKFSNGSSTSLTKYVTDSKYGTVDDKVILGSEDDAAQVNLGEGWRMPTFEEFQELRDQCNWEWTEDYNGTGIKGRIVRSLVSGYTDHYIFLPAGGCCNDSETRIYSVNQSGYYYSSSLNLGSNSGANGFVFYDSSSDGRYGEQCRNVDGSRYLGKNIRPVRDFEVAEKSVFKLYKSTEVFDPNGQKYAVSLLSNKGGQCDLSQVSGWVTLLSQSGKTFLFSIAKNKTGATRNGKIVFRSIDGSKTCSLSVSQEPSSDIDATSLSLSFSNTSGTIGGDLYIGSTYKFSVTASPSNATTKYEWKVEDTRVATISGSGSSATLSTKDFGKTAVVVTEKNSGLTARYEFGTAVTNFQFTESTGETAYGAPKITMVVGEKHQIQYSCTPSYATRVFSDLRAFNFREVKSGVYVIVGQSSVVDIDENGLMTAKKEGTTLIKANNDYGVYKANSGIEEIYVQVQSEYTEKEPNNDFPYANQLKLGASTSFFISTTTDVDVFQFSAGKTSISFDLTYAGDGVDVDKHLRWELYDSSCELRGSGTFSLRATGETITMTNKLVGTSGGYLKFYFPTNWYSYPETLPSGKLTLKVY